MDKLDKAMILQAFKSEEFNRQRNTESVNKARAFGKGSTNLADILSITARKKKKRRQQQSLNLLVRQVLLMIMKLMSHLLTYFIGIQTQAPLLI